MNAFFDRNTFVVDQKVWTVANSYRVLDEAGEQIGLIQENLPLSRLLLSFILSKKNLPWSLELQGLQKETILSVEKKFSFITASIEIKQAETVIAKVKQKFTLLKPEYEIQDPNGQIIGRIKGNFIGWDFTIFDAQEQEIASINKKFELTLKEIFTDSDKYKIEIKNTNLDEKMRAIIVACAGIVDMVNREEND